MWEYLSPDLAFDVVKGLIAGAASLALQVVGPRLLRALKRYRARGLARKDAGVFSRESLSHAGRGEGGGSPEENASQRETEASAPIQSERQIV